MPQTRHYDLQRFKKSWNGMKELATFLEQTSAVRREEILTQLEYEDPEFFREIMRRVVFFEELIYLESGILMQILNGVSRRVLAQALADTPKEFRDAILGYLPFAAVREIQDEEERGGPLAKGTILAAQRRVLKCARDIEEENGVPLEVLDCPRLARVEPLVANKK
jgi:flagellar motor switch protein FliG